MTTIRPWDDGDHCVCDLCHIDIVPTQQAYAKGWIYRNGQDFCPDCKPAFEGASRE